MVSEESTPRDAPLDGGAFEVAEIDRMVSPQQLQNAVDLRVWPSRMAFRRRVAAGDAGQPPGDSGRRQHEVR